MTKAPGSQGPCLVREGGKCHLLELQQQVLPYGFEKKGACTFRLLIRSVLHQLDWDGTCMKLRAAWRPISAALLVIATSTMIVPATAEAAAAPSPNVKYEFNGTLTDSASGSSLSVMPACPGPSGGQCNSTTSYGSDASGDYWRWTSTSPRGGGFTITTNSPLTSTYSMALKFVFDSEPVDEYSKIIDWDGKLLDNGFYFKNWYINFFIDASPNTDENGLTQYSAGTVMDLVITRDETTKFFTVYAKSSSGSLEQVFQYTDTTGSAVPMSSGSGSLIGFFFDDDDTNDEGNDGGRVYDVEMWNGVALTSAEVAALIAPTAGQSDGGPPPWLQSYGRTQGGVCKTGWHASWAEWATSVTGGWVCNRTIFWNGSSWVQNPNAVWGIANPAETARWDGS